MRSLFLILLIYILLLPTVFSQVDVQYQRPHQSILELADVDLPPRPVLNEAKDKAIFLYADQYKSLEELSEKELRLGGLRINPVTNIGSRTNYYNRLTLFLPEEQQEVTITGLPDNPRIANLAWSPNQSYMAFTNTEKTGVSLWIIDLEQRKASKLTENALNANIGRPYEWISNDAMIVQFLPSDRKELIDKAESVPGGPTVSVNDGAKAQNRTYQDLLSDESDEQNFEQLTRSELHKVTIDGSSSQWLQTGMYKRIDASPNGDYLLVEEMKKPFSYLVPYYRFPFTISVYSNTGDKVATIADVPLEEERPKGFMSTRTGIRNVSWRNDKPATLYYVKALDEGDAEKEVPYRDEVFLLEEPFTSSHTSIGKTTDRFNNIIWGNDDYAISYEYWWDTRMVRGRLFNPSEGIQQGAIIEERDYQDRYNDPGQFVTKRNQFGKNTLLINDGKLYLTGDGYSDDGILPFFDELDLSSLEKNRRWRASDTSKLESIVDVLDVQKGLLLQRIESSSDFPNYFIRDVSNGKPPKQITDFNNPFTSLENIHKEVITYQREDGLNLSATLYLPADYQKESGEKLPMLLWAYPREFKNKQAASQVTSSSNEFTYPWYGSPIFWVNRGYAVLDDAAFPIIGEGEEEPNDTFITQLVSNAKAAIDAVDSLGYIDRTRVGVGGHSYGAFMAANLLTHSDLFAAGIARSGAYNRSLTPFGFQSEERNFWEASDVYFRMSPFMNAEKMNHPLLLIHGEADNNSGTYPMQSERYFNALKGLGATVRLVMLPKESHGYRAKKNIMHMLWEQDQWLEKYVKNKGK